MYDYICPNCFAHLESAVACCAPELCVEEVEVVEGGVPGQKVVLLLQVADEGESCAVAQLTGPGQVQRVVNQLRAPGQVT